MRVAVIGAGPAGLAAGHELMAQGFTDFTIFEKAGAVGGTWHLHTYPGLACDLWAHSYTFSYRPNPDWSANFVSQSEIEAYLQQCAVEFGLTPHIALDTQIVSAKFQTEKTWLLGSSTGDTFLFDAVINAMGNQHTPQFPKVDGLDDFAGESFHGTRWDHSVNLSGKRVAIVGSAASAIQIVPEVAKQAKHLTVLQRTPNWIMSRGKKSYSRQTSKLFNRFPSLLRLYIRYQGFMMGLVLGGVTLGHKRMEQFEDIARKFIKKSIADENLRATVTPTSRYGCKRGLVSDDFYPAIQRHDVELLAEGLASVRPGGITVSSGRDIDVDVIIYCTGYRMFDFDRINVVGTNGKELATQMAMSPQAYKGIAVPEFPNYFFAAGPNGLAINVSYFANVERNLETAISLLKQASQQECTAISVKHSVHQDYNKWLAPRFEHYSWGYSQCSSYYRTPEGHVPFLFPGGFKEYQQLHSACSMNDFECI